MSNQKFGSFADGEGFTGSKGWKNEEHKEEEESCDIDPDYLFAYDEEEDIYCETCHCSMSGPKTFEAHLAGARHKKNVKNSELGAPVRPSKVDVPMLQMKNGKKVTWMPKCQVMIDAFDKPLIGLQYVTEWRHRNHFVESRYYCSICKAKCDVRMLTSHMTGVKHRVAYMKLFYPEMAARVRAEGRKTDQAPLAEHCARQIEEKEGRQSLRVKAEGFPNCEGDKDDKELEEFIASNKQNFYRHMMSLGLRTYFESKKSRGAHGVRGSQPTRVSSGMSWPFSGMSFSGSHSASDSGYDSIGLSGYQPPRLRTGFDSYEPQRSAMSGSVPQSKPHYVEDSDYRRQSSAGYGSGHSSRDQGGQCGGCRGQSGGHGGQSSGYGVYQQGRYEDDEGYDRDRFQSGVADSSWNSSAMRADHSLKPHFPSYSADLRSGPSYGVRGFRDSGRPYPVNRPSRFSSQGALSEDYTRFQSRY